MAKKLTVSRKGHTRRKTFATSRGGTKKVKGAKIAKTRVKPSTFKIRDRGKPGRGPRIIPPLEEGGLGGPGFFDRASEEQEQIVFRRAREVGERKIVGELRALQVLFKTTDPQKSRRALELSKKVAGSFKDRQEVGFPKGFSNKQ
jgi:hypothetical protein